MMRPFVHFLVVCALILAGISPACAFISGQTTIMEICTAQGVKQITINDPAPADTTHDKKSGDDCMFCFAQAHGKSLKADGFVAIFAPAAAQDTVDLRRAPFAQTAFYNPHAPRAPPVLL